MADENRITNCEPQTDPVRRETNKKLSTISKESKSKRKLRKPDDEKNDPVFKLPNVDPMCVLAIIGVVIAGLSLYYTRISVVGTQKKPNGKVRSVEHEVQEVLEPVVVQQSQKNRRKKETSSRSMIKH